MMLQTNGLRKLKMEQDNTIMEMVILLQTRTGHKIMFKKKFIFIFITFIAVIAFGLNSHQIFAQTTVTVLPNDETDPVVGTCDSADDTAVWIHPTDPSLSLIIGTDKFGYAQPAGGSCPPPSATITGGLEVYDLSGNKLQILGGKQTGNVDLRYNFPLAGQKVAIVVASDENKAATLPKVSRLYIYKVDASTRSLIEVTAGPIDITGKGIAMYLSPVTGKYYALVNGQGKVQQWELFDNGAGGVAASLIRTVDFPGSTNTEGVAADDILKVIYASDEPNGVYKFNAEPTDALSPVLMDSVTTAGGHLTPDVEGITIYYKSDGTGYILVSSQNADSFDVYTREGSNTYIGRFKVGALGTTIDAVTHTDGIDVTNFPLGLQYPQGLFIAQDDSNPGAYKNHKIVKWENVVSALSLTSDTTWDPRLVGAGPVTPGPTQPPGATNTPTPTPS